MNHETQNQQQNRRRRRIALSNNTNQTNEKINNSLLRMLQSSRRTTVTTKDESMFCVMCRCTRIVLMMTTITIAIVLLSRSTVVLETNYDGNNGSKTIQRMLVPTFNNNEQNKQQISPVSQVALYNDTTRTDNSSRSTIHQHQQQQYNQILYTGSFGIGHRMNKISSIIHFCMANVDTSSSLQQYIDHIKVEWGTCPIITTNHQNDSNLTNNTTHLSHQKHSDNMDIFQYLFQSQYIPIHDLQQIYSITSNQLTAPVPMIMVKPSTTFTTTIHDDDNNIIKNSNNKTIWIRNDVHGYYAGQAYKNSKKVLKVNDTETIQKYYISKLQSDAIFYTRWLRSHRFIGYQQVQEYIRYHQFDQHYMIGVHIRAGNGEQQHFIQSQRNILFQKNHNSKDENDDDMVVQQIAFFINELYQMSLQSKDDNDTLPPLVFLATDTEHYINALSNALLYYHIPMITYQEQPRIPYGYGVSYDTNIYTTTINSTTTTSGTTGVISCYDSWYGSMMDMMILSYTNTLIATTRSTFTQIVPMSILFHKSNLNSSSEKGTNHFQYTNKIYKYCEMDLLSNSTTSTSHHMTPRTNTTTTIIISKMTCFMNATSWLLRNNSSEWYTFCSKSIRTTTTNDDSTANTGKSVFNITSYGCHPHSEPPVTHKLMVHLPDVTVVDQTSTNVRNVPTVIKTNSLTTSSINKIYLDMIHFLHPSTTVLSNETVYYYGKKYNTKYRYNSKKKNLKRNMMLQVDESLSFQSNWTWE